jgi:hypothetical protein
MLADKLCRFNDLVSRARAEIGMNAPAIADRVIGAAFPETVDAAEREGADKMLRQGVIAQIKNIFKAKHGDPAQGDFMHICDEFRPIVSRLQSDTQYVPELAEFIEVAALIDNPEWLDSARKFKHLKADETKAEAKILDELYEAVIAAREREAELEPVE